MAIFSTRIESDERIVAVTLDEYKSNESMKSKIDLLKKKIEETEKHAVNSKGEKFPALVYCDDIREIFGWPKDDGLKVIF